MTLTIITTMIMARTKYQTCNVRAVRGIAIFLSFGSGAYFDFAHIQQCAELGCLGGLSTLR